MLQLNKRIGNLQLKLEFLDSNKNKISEIVEWIDNENFTTICYFVEYSENWLIKFVGSRPFEIDNQEALWQLLKFGQRVLNAQFEFKKAIE